jgi:hypothetical protein
LIDDKCRKEADREWLDHVTSTLHEQSVTGVRRRLQPGEKLPQARSHVMIDEVDTWPSRRELDFG